MKVLYSKENIAGKKAFHIMTFFFYKITFSLYNFSNIDFQTLMKGLQSHAKIKPSSPILPTHVYYL